MSLVIRSTVTRRKVGQTGVGVLALTSNVFGIRTDFFAPADQPSTRADLARSAEFEAARYYRQGAGEVILRRGTLFQGATDLPSAASELNPGEAVSGDLVLYADRSWLDSVCFQISLSPAKQDDSSVPLAFEPGETRPLRAVAGPGCRTEPECCRAVTDFATEVSLW